MIRVVPERVARVLLTLHRCKRTVRVENIVNDTYARIFLLDQSTRQVVRVRHRIRVIAVDISVGRLLTASHRS